MNENEKIISFFNNYFIFKKTHNVNAGQVSLIISEDSKEEIDDATNEGEELTETSNIQEKTIKQKLKTKLTLSSTNNTPAKPPKKPPTPTIVVKPARPTTPTPPGPTTPKGTPPPGPTTPKGTPPSAPNTPGTPDPRALNNTPPSKSVSQNNAL